MSRSMGSIQFDDDELDSSNVTMGGFCFWLQQWQQKQMLVSMNVLVLAVKTLSMDGTLLS